MKRIALCILFFGIIISLKYAQNRNDMNDLSNKLINTETGTWVLKGTINDEHFIYALGFNKENKISFSYSSNYTNGPGSYYLDILRRGTFFLENNIAIINFNTVIGRKYNRPNSWDEPIMENVTIKLEIAGPIEYKIMVRPHRGKRFYLENPDFDQAADPDIEITEYKIIVKQISGKNIFEHYGENSELEFIASRPIID